jgi:hypothetical protein
MIRLNREVYHLLCVGVGWLLFATLGCVQYVPPVIYEQTQNQPPRILLDGITPTETFLTIKVSDPAQETITFTVPRVLDPDEDDLLYAYWFINRDQAPPESIRCPQTIPPVEPSLRNQPGRIPGVREADITCLINVKSSRFVPKTRVLLELIIGDRQPRQVGQFPNSRGEIDWPEGTQWVRWYWLLRVED